MLDAKLAEYMQRILEQGKLSVTAGKSSLEIHDQYALGRRIGKTIHFTDRDQGEMRRMLTANGYALVPVAKDGMARSDRLAAGVPNEKSGGGAVKTGRVSVKAMPGECLNLSGKALALPPFCHIDACWSEIVNSVGHSALMVVENYEVFDKLHLIRFSLPAEFSSPLVVYRGDRHESRQDNVRAFLDAAALPVLACVDIDPQGLQIALSFPRLIGLVAPGKAHIEELLQSPATGRRDLFQQQYHVVAGILERLPQKHCLAPLWALVKESRAGVVQERWISSDELCVLWS